MKDTPNISKIQYSQEQNVKQFFDIILDDNAKQVFFENYNGQFKNWLVEILPEVENCRLMPQNNPWHIYNVLEHILTSVENINKQTKEMEYSKRKMLAFVMFMHDIGKPQCHIKRIKNGAIVDSFYDHNFASRDITKRVLKHFDFDETEQKQIELLVREHDFFMGLIDKETNNPYKQRLTQKVVDKEIERFNFVGNGKELCKMLCLVGRADNLAQNPKMIGESLKLIDKIESMIDN